MVGESIAVVGNLEELGVWKEYKCHLEWTDGHIWRSVEPIIVRESYFEYKYVMLEEDKVIAWEEGVNRIADLDALPEVTDKVALKNMIELIPKEFSTSKIKHCQFDDRWEEYIIRFTVFDPLYQPGDEMLLVPNAMTAMQTIRMERMKVPTEWLTSKYGAPVPLWQCELPMKNAHGDSEGQYLQSHNVALQYSYVKKGKGGRSREVVERQPERALLLRDPKIY